MSAIHTYQEVLDRSNKIALATALDTVPDVRIVNYCYEQAQPSILYFASDRDNRKVTQVAQNNVIAFASVPSEGIFHVRSLKATVTKSSRSIDDMAQLFIAAIPGYDETIAAIGDTLDVFEIHVTEAMVIIGFEEPEIVAF